MLLGARHRGYPNDLDLGPLRGHSSLVHSELVTSKRDCGHRHPRGGSNKVWDKTLRHIVIGFKVRGQIEPKTRKKVGFGGSHTGLQDLIKSSRYMGNEQRPSENGKIFTRLHLSRSCREQQMCTRAGHCRKEGLLTRRIAEDMLDSRLLFTGLQLR